MSVAGYTKVLRIKTTASVDWSNVPANTATLNFSGEMLDDTTFDSTGYRSRIRGLIDYNISLTAVYSTSSSALGILKSALTAGTRLNVQYLPNGSNGYAGTCVVENFTHTGDVGGLETIDVSLQPTLQTALTTV